ncbi:hypothetical protein KZY42_004236 [Vibrio vulnificus]|nr:hypothetical protein [Vibrio vulnificus]EHU9446749.1 hypothetical protein [Vibrio vulnificus]EJV2652576.1 hypothetical protein [Vibrio vulnificus]MCU8501607.1 hypothetical protein [Vibrio vulnificus]HAS8452569.1 hypothetical protein [Vibrio vulnificus]
MATEYRSFFNIGLYDPVHFDRWPYGPNEHDSALYLSTKKRKCGWGKAAEFNSIDEARAFFNDWKNSSKLKMHIVEFKKYVEVPDPIYPENHPHSLLKRIHQGEKHSVWVTAELWFRGQISTHYVSKQTLRRHRDILINYGVDIAKEPEQVYEPPKMKRDDVWYTASPNLKALD